MSQKIITFPRKSEKELVDILRKYHLEVEVTNADLRAPEARWWQELLFVLLKKNSWITFSEKQFIERVQSVPANRRSYFCIKLLHAFWSEIGTLALFKPPLEVLDIIRPTKERVMGLLSAFINLDAFIASIPHDPGIESFGEILEETKRAEEHYEDLEVRVKELEVQVSRKQEEVAQNAEHVYRLRCEADEVAAVLQNEKDTLDNLSSVCEEKNDAIHTLELKIEEFQSRIGQFQSEIDRIRPYHVPDMDAFLEEPMLLRRKLEDLRKEVAETARRHAEYMELIQVYQHLDEELKTCYALFERNVKTSRELEDIAQQLSTIEEQYATLQADFNTKMDEQRQLKSFVDCQERQQVSRQRQASPPPSQQSASGEANEADDDEIKGRLEEGDALMALEQECRRVRQQIFVALGELDQRYHEKRDRLADNHDQYIDFIRGMVTDLQKEGMLPVVAEESDENRPPTSSD